MSRAAAELPASLVASAFWIIRKPYVSGSGLAARPWSIRHSNEPLIQTREELDRFVGELNRNPKSVTGVLQKPLDQVRALTAEAYPGTNGESLQILWARHFPTQGSANALWVICALCLGGTAVYAVLYRRHQ